MQVEVLKSLGDLHLEKGKLSKASAEFEKAAALYADALLHCTDPDKKQALEHDLELSELSRQLLQGYSPQYQWSQDYRGTADNSILRVAETCDKLDKEGGNIEQTYAEMLVTAIANKNVILELEVLKSLGDLYFKKGKKTLNVSQFSKAAAMYKKALTKCGDPETKQTLVHRALYMVKIWEGVRKQTSRLAEKHFAAALKKVHVRDPTAQQYQREVEPMCKLGDVYSKRGQQTGDGGDFVKAAALYNAAIARSEDQVLNGNIEIAIKEVEKSFFKCILGIHSNVSHNNTEKHKKQLREMRDQIKLEMETIGQQLDPYVHDEDDPCVKEIEAKRAQAVRHLFERIAKERKEFISLLVEECIGLMGPSPCKYALIGLGSQATGLVTPYSDLEFAILVEKESEECLVFFRNITHYLHLKVVNLGETILPALGITSLNDFYSKNPLDDWYYDSVTPRGFAFDGSMPMASKTPLGRQGTMNKPPSELICTPQNMVSILQNDVRLYMKEGYHLATILRNPCLIAGIIPTTVWETIDKMEDQQVISPNNAHHLTVLTSISAELRLRTYIATGISYLEQALQMYRIIYGLGTAHRYIAILLNMLGAAYSGLGHYGKAMSYLEQALQMYRSMYGENTAHPDIASVLNNLGITRKKLSDLKNAVSYLEQALRMNRTVFGYGTAHVEIATSLGNLGAVWYSLGDYKKSHSYHEMALVVNRSIYGQGTMHPHIALSLNNLGLALDNLGEKRKAISYYEQALQMHRIIYSKNTTHPDTVRILNNLGASWDSLGDHRKAISYHEQALQEWKSIHGHSTKHPDIAMSLIHLGQALVSLGDYRKAISHYEQALQMYKSIYGQISDHSDIVASLNNLGGAFQLLGKYRTAAWYYKQGLQMSRRIYGQNKAHPQIAESLSGLGSAFDQLADYREAISCHKQALQMRRSIHGQTAAHPMILSSLIYVGSALHHQGDKKKAISYYEQGLQMCRSVYGQSTPHPQIATLLNNLGSAWGEFGDHSKAISFLEQALQMERSIYGLTTAHREIANTLNTLGIIWQALGNNKKALSLCQEALAMARQVDSEMST
ncbi:hypothetical protein Bbelb_280870 [Branchiostoma belcheri]|nr:hypothetical protein Bbelb_280870 [Branchiostoma belcheri]